jgi:hypothetical protein
MKLIQTIALTSNAASVEFASIPQTFTDLVLFISARTVTENNFNDFGINLGGTQTNRRLQGNGSSVSSSVTTGYLVLGLTNTSVHTANTFSNSFVYIPNYTSSNAKVLSAEGVIENNASQAEQGIFAGLTTTTSAITALAGGSGADLVAGSSFSLYGILKGSDGIVTTS